MGSGNFEILRCQRCDFLHFDGRGVRGWGWGWGQTVTENELFIIIGNCKITFLGRVPNSRLPSLYGHVTFSDPPFGLQVMTVPPFCYPKNLMIPPKSPFPPLGR